MKVTVLWIAWIANWLIAAPCAAGDRWEQIERFFSPPEKLRDELGAYRSPLTFAGGAPVHSVHDWQRRRAEILTQWHDLMGHWPELLTEPDIEVLDSVRRENFEQRRVRFHWTPTEMTTGYLLIPDGDGPRPAVLTVYYEPETAIGLGKPNRDFGLQLARRGVVVLSIGTTEATAAKTYALYYPSIDHAEIQPLSMLAYAAANAWHVLASLPEVDSRRIGIVGHSFGGKWAMFASCLFDKFACAVWSDPGIVFDKSRPNVNYWEPWYLGYHPPPWRRRDVITPGNPARGLYPRLVATGHDLHELHALMAPRPFLVSGGAEDPPKRWAALNHSIEVNRLLGYENRVAMTNRLTHDPTVESNEVIYKFFEHFLGNRSVDIASQGAEGISPSRSTAPYPPSPVIRGITWAPKASIVRSAQESDNWPLTWADDGHLYTTWGDGNGFSATPRRSMGFARIMGDPPKHLGTDIRSQQETLGHGELGKKGWGILCVEGVLYLWLGHADGHGGQAQLAWSTDHAKTWSFANWKFAQFGLVGFINFGRDYQGARDNYVYAYSHDSAKANTPADRFVLMRVPKNQLTDRTAYEFFQGMDTHHTPQWTRDLAKRGSVFENPGACLRSAMTYNRALKRYLWWQHLPAPPDRGDQGDTRFQGGFGIYDAHEPWGPWTTVYFTEQWDVGPGEHADFPSKWISQDGKTVHLAFSGDDSFSVRRATLSVAEESATPAETVNTTLIKELKGAKLSMQFHGQTTDECRAWQKGFRAKLNELLGDTRPPKQWKVTEEARTVMEDHVRYELLLESDEVPTVPVYLLVPMGLEKGTQAPGVICVHGHGPFGHHPVVGRRDRKGVTEAIRDSNYDYGLQFVRRGYVVVAPCLIPFGRRVDRNLYGSDPCAVTLVRMLAVGKLPIAENVRDLRWAIDFLQSRPEVIDDRIGCAGLSYGGRMTMLVSALDDRIRVAAVSGALNLLQERLSEPYSCGSQIIPGLLNYGDFSEVGSLIAPRPCVWETGSSDHLILPRWGDIFRRRLRQAYQALDAEQELHFDHFEGAHAWSGKIAFPVFDQALMP